MEEKLVKQMEHLGRNSSRAILLRLLDVIVAKVVGGRYDMMLVKIVIRGG